MTTLARQPTLEAAQAAHAKTERLRRRLASMGMPGIYHVNDNVPATAGWWVNKAYDLGATPPIKRARTRLHVDGHVRVLEIWFEDWMVSAQSLAKLRPTTEST